MEPQAYLRAIGCERRYKNGHMVGLFAGAGVQFFTQLGQPCRAGRLPLLGGTHCGTIAYECRVLGPEQVMGGERGGLEGNSHFCASPLSSAPFHSRTISPNVPPSGSGGGPPPGQPGCAEFRHEITASRPLCPPWAVCAAVWGTAAARPPIHPPAPPQRRARRCQRRPRPRLRPAARRRAARPAGPPRPPPGSRRLRRHLRPLDRGCRLRFRLYVWFFSGRRARCPPRHRPPLF